MDRTKSLYELGEEYLAQAQVLKNQIDRTREKLRTKKLTRKQRLAVESNLAMLYTQRRDVLETGNRLMTYYDKGGKAA